MKQFIHARLSLLWLLALVIFLFGCGGGGTEGSSGGGSSGGGGNSVTLRSNVKVVSESAPVNVSATDEEVTLQGTTLPDVQVGDVLLSQKENGLICKVKGVHRGRVGEMTLATEQGTLEDVYADTSVSVDLDVDPTQATFTPADSAVTFEPENRSRVSGEYSGNFGKIIIQSYTLAGSGDSKIIARGELNLALSVRLAYDYRLIGGLQSFTFAPRLTTTGSLRLSGNINSSLSKRFKLGTLRSSFTVGSVPCQFDLDLYINANGQITAGVDVESKATMFIAPGVSYSNGSWSADRDFGHSYDFIPKALPSGSANGSLALEGELSLLIAGVVGPSVKATAPELAFSLTLKDGHTVRLFSNATFKASVGVKAEVLGRTIVNKQFPDFYVNSFTLVDKDFTFTPPPPPPPSEPPPSEPPPSNPPPPPTSGVHYDVWRGGSEADNRAVAWAAQSFIAQFGTINKVTFNAGGPSGGNFADSATVFISTNEAMTNHIAAVLVSDLVDYGATTAVFPNPVAVNPGQRYWVQIHTGESGKPVLIYSSKFGGDYGSGISYWHGFNASTIPDSGHDLNLKIE